MDKQMHKEELKDCSHHWAWSDKRGVVCFLCEAEHSESTKAKTIGEMMEKIEQLDSAQP